MRCTFVAGTMIALLGLTGCSGPMLNEESSPSTQINGFYDYGAAERDLRLTVYGNPFPAAQTVDVFAKMVETDAKVPTMRAPTHLTLTPNETARSNFSVIFVFQPAATLTGQDLCSGQHDSGPAPEGLFGGGQSGDDAGSATVRSIAAFCVSGVAKTQVSGQTQASGPADPRVRQLIQGMVQTLFRPDRRETGTHGNLQP